MLTNCHNCAHDRGEECAALADDDLFSGIMAWLWSYRESVDRVTGTPPSDADGCPGFNPKETTCTP